jgi:hypothetical protein
MTPKHLRTLVLSLAAVLPATAALVAQTNTSMPRSPITLSRSDTGAVVTTHNWTDEQILTCTVSECWHLSGRNEATFFDIVQQLTEISAQHRGLTLPDSAAAGQKMGEMIKQKTKADRDQLLYAVVDNAVRKVGTKAPTQ